MKKGLLCLIVAMLMVLPLLLASCGDEMTAEEIANANFQKADKALTLSVWLPVKPTVDSDGDGVADALDYRFYGTKEEKGRLEMVEEAINDYLLSNNYSTKLDFVFYTEDEYYTKLTEKFAEIKELEKTGITAKLQADKYVNHAEKDPETGLYKMAYPSVLDQQLDIFFVGGYDNYTNYIENGDVHALDKFFTEGQTYNCLFKMIRSAFLDATKINGSYYGIPNNHVFSEKGQYVLVDKNLYDTYANIKWDDTYTLLDLEFFINTIGENNLEGVIPYCGTKDDVPGVIYLDKENLIAATTYDATTNEETGKTTFYTMHLPQYQGYKDYLSFYFGLEEKGYVSNTSNSTAAVRMFNGNLVDIENRDDYYIIETIPPYASVDSVFSSMFAISSHSANHERAMQMLQLLYENDTLRTLLQSGVEDVDYKKGVVDGETVIYTKDSGYNMELLYTGNCYRTYPASGVPMSYWDFVKDYNLETQLHPFFWYQLKMHNNEFPDSTMEKLDGFMAILGEANVNAKLAIEAIDADIYAEWLNGRNASYYNRAITTARNNYDKAKTAYDAAKAAYDSAATQEAKDEALAEMQNQQAKMDEQNKLLNTYINVQFIANVTASDLVQQINDLLNLYQEMYQSVQ